MPLRANARVAAGAIAGLLGIFFTIQNFFAFLPGGVQFFWPLLVVAFGISRIIERGGRSEGLLLLLVGGGVQLANFGLFVLPAREAVRYWPLAVVVAGLREMVLSRDIRFILEGSAIVLLGAWLQLSYFGFVHISSYRLWPLALVAVGGVMAWRGIYEQSSS